MKVSSVLSQVRSATDSADISVWNDKRKADRRIKIRCSDGKAMGKLVKVLCRFGIDIEFHDDCVLFYASLSNEVG